MGIYEEYIFHPLLEVTMRRTLALRGSLLAEIGGDVVEVGIGAGTNLPFYQGRVRTLAAVEPDPALAAKCLSRAHALSIPMSTMVADLSALPAASADAAVLTFVLCSVGDVPVILSQLRRVLRPGGKLYLLEHVAAEGVKRLAQRAVRPLWRRAFGQCDPCVELHHTLDSSGFSVGSLSSIQLEMPWLVSSGVMGQLSLRT